MKKLMFYSLHPGDLFRIADLNKVGPEVWTWKGKFHDEERQYGYVCESLVDGRKTILYPTNWIVPLEGLETF